MIQITFIALIILCLLKKEVQGIPDIFPKQYSNWFPEVTCITWMDLFENRFAVGCGDISTVWLYQLDELELKWELEETFTSPREGYGAQVYLGKDIIAISEMTNVIQVQEYTNKKWSEPDQCLYTSPDPFYDDIAFGAVMTFTNNGILISDPHAQREIRGKMSECVGIVYFVPYERGCHFGDRYLRFEPKVPTENAYFGFPISINQDSWDSDDRQLVIGSSGEDSGHDCAAGRVYYYSNYSEPQYASDINLFNLGIAKEDIDCVREMRFGIALTMKRGQILAGGFYSYMTPNPGYAFSCEVMHLDDFNCTEVPNDDKTSSFTAAALQSRDFINLETKEPLYTNIFDDPDDCLIYVYYDRTFETPPQVYNLSNDLSELAWIVQGKFHLIVANETNIVVLENDTPHTFVPTSAPTKPPLPKRPFANWKILLIVGSLCFLMWLFGIYWKYTYSMRQLDMKKVSTYMTKI